MIQVSNLTKSFGDQLIFQNITFSINRREIVGLVGRNGSGKSTIFKILMEELASDFGTIIIPKKYKMGLLSQHIKFSKKTILDECVLALPEQRVYDTYIVEKILFGLGFQESDLNKDPATFSGGFQLRINLAKLLIEAPDLLLLDEPTNYLDIVSLRWLKVFLKSYPGEIILITHDQAFMNDIVTHTMGIYRRKLKKIKGNVQKLKEEIALEEEIYEQTKENLDRKKKEVELFVERFRAKASKAKQAQSRLKMLEKMGSMDELEREKRLAFRFHYQDLPSKNLFGVEDLSFGYSFENMLINGLSFEVKKGDKIGIIGKNGKGKSTLLNLLGGYLTANKGRINQHPSLNIGHFGQTNISRLNEKLTIEQEITSENNDLSKTQVRNICGTMMFEGDLADKRISVLSGGEKSRVLLGKILAHKTNVLLLDEPNNHLDAESINSMIDEINEYLGAVIIVTHDEKMLKEVANKLIIFQKDCVDFFDGSYNEFLEKIGWEDEVSIDLKKKKKSFKDIKRLKAELISEKSKVLKPLQTEINDLEEMIIENERLIEIKNKSLISASEKQDGNLINNLSKEVYDLEKVVNSMFNALELKSYEMEKSQKSFDQRIKRIDKL